MHVECVSRPVLPRVFFYATHRPSTCSAAAAAAAGSAGVTVRISRMDRKAKISFNGAFINHSGKKEEEVKEKKKNKREK